MESPSFPAAGSRVVPCHQEERSLVFQLQHTGLFRRYQSAFETATGLPLALRASGAFQEPLHGSRHINPFCALMVRHSNSCAACLRMQEQVEQAAVLEPRTLECGAGLSESAVPVRAGDKLIGFLQTGQVFLRAPTKPRYRAFRKEIDGFGEHAGAIELEQAYFQTPVIDAKQYASVLQLLRVFALQLGAIAAQMLVQEAMAEVPAMAKARAYIADHLADELSLQEVARVANMSAFYFCKFFRRSTGLTFTAYLANLRVETVKNLLSNPAIRISEAAYAAGFQSLSQFNRVFRRLAGASPTDYRGRLHLEPTRRGTGGD